jgi:PiT family inorganic phosphate transporter
VRWGVTLRIVWAWIFTIPSAAFIAGALYYLLNLVF